MLCLIVGICERSSVSLRNNAFLLLFSVKTNVIIMPLCFLYFLHFVIIFCNNSGNNNKYNNGYNKNYFYIQNSDFVPFPKIILVGSIFVSKHLCFYAISGCFTVFFLQIKPVNYLGVCVCEVDIFLYPHM